jgi:hypothetical protein
MRSTIQKMITLIGFSLMYANSSSNQTVCEPNSCMAHLYIAVDYLHWKAEEDQLQYALNIPGGFNKDGLVFSNQIFIAQPCFKKKSGVRTKIGFSASQNWDAIVAWTHYNTNPASQLRGDLNGVLATPAFGLLDVGGLLGSGANTNWCLKFNTIDLELARDWWFCESAVIRPHIGFKWAQINQSQNISYLGIDGIGLDLTRTNNFSAIGPRLGIDEKWYVFNDFSFIGTLSGALVYGTFHATALSIISAPGTAETLHPVIIENKKRIRPTLQLLVGFGKDFIFYNDTTIEISAAYEAQYWWNQWQVPTTFATLTAFTPSGDLMLHGLTFHLGIQF